MKLLIRSQTSWNEFSIQLHWRHNDHDSVSNHQPHGCLINHLFRSRSKKTSKLRVIGLCVGNSPGPVNSPHKGSVTRKIFPFDDVIMRLTHRGRLLPNLVSKLEHHQHIEAETKWLPFRRRHFQMHFHWIKMSKFRLKFHWILFLKV